MENFPVNRFDGGITDNYLKCPPGSHYLLHNFFLDENATPFVRPGFFCFDERIPTISGSTRLSGLYLGDEPFGLPLAIRGDSVYFDNESGGWTEILGPTGNKAAPNKTFSDLEDGEIWQRQLIYASSPDATKPHRIFCTDDSPLAFTALTLGLPELASTPTLGSAGGSGNTYIYAFHYFYQFTDYKGTTFEEKGPLVFATASNVGAPNSNTITISAIPVLANTSSTNYDTSTSLKVRVLRSVNNGTALFKVKDVDNGTTSTTDTLSDTDLQLNEPSYTDGGILEYAQPPLGAKYLSEVNDFFWYATDRMVTHSIQGAPGACPAEYQQPTDQKVRGLSNIISFPILFCDKSVYRIEGNFDEFGDLGFELREISKTAGCVSNKSIVSIEGGLVWFGNGGIYFTDGYKVQKISVGLESRYAIWKNASIAGTFDALRNQAVWTISSAENSQIAPNDSFLTLHLNFGIRPSSSFTTFGSRDNIFPTSLAFSLSLDVDEAFRGKLLVGENRGYLLYQDDLAFTDPRINTDLYPEYFTKTAIIYRLESAGLDFGDDSSRKWCTELTAEFRNETDIATQFLTRRDDGGPWGTFSEIRKDGAMLWDISEWPWEGDEDEDTPSVLHDWDSQAVVEGRRFFPRNTLRSNRRQIGLTNAKTYISKSDDLGLATVSAAARTFTLETVGQIWPDDCEEYEIGFLDEDSGEYSYFLIASRDSDTQITVYDPYASLVSGSALKWQMRGYRKFERPYLLSFTIWFTPEGNTQEPSRGTVGLVNA